MKRAFSIFLTMFFAINIYAQEVTTDSITKLYVATFDRAPEKSGIDYWLNSSGLDLEEIATSFFEQQETKEKYPNGYGDINFINAVYSNLFKRTSDSVGAEYWLEQLNSGNISNSLFILAVINGAVGDDATILENKTVVGLEFMRSSSNNIKQAYAVMQDITKDKQSVLDAFAVIDNLQVDGVCDNNIKNGCDIGSVVGEYESDDYYIWFCQNSKGTISNQCQLKKEPNIAKCDNSIKSGCSVGLAVGENQTDDNYFWYCKTDESLSYECKIARGDNKNTPECDMSEKNSCSVGEYSDDSQDDEFYYWYCKTDEAVSNRCKISKEPTVPECSDIEYQCLSGVVYNKEGMNDFEDIFKWTCKSDLDSIACKKDKTEKLVDIDALSEVRRVWTPLDCYDYSGDSKEQGYTIQYDFKEYASRCASSVEVQSYNTSSFDEDRLISTLKQENQSKLTVNFCENAYKDDVNGTEYKYEFNTITKDSCLKTIYQ
jgi:hypothetical protein